MKLHFQDRTEPLQAVEIKPGVRLYALTDGSNKIQSLTLETKSGHTLVEVKNGKLCKALKECLPAKK